MEAESEQKQEIQKGQRLSEKQELVRAVADKRQQASGGLQKSMLKFLLMHYAKG